jgi:hypothetical protein
MFTPGPAGGMRTPRGPAGGMRTPRGPAGGMRTPSQAQSARMPGGLRRVASFQLMSQSQHQLPFQTPGIGVAF